MIWFYEVKFWRNSEEVTERGLIDNDNDNLIEELANAFGSIQLGSIVSIILKPIGNIIGENDIFDLFD